MAKGIILFPKVFHLRIDPAMKQAIIGHGGARWVRSIVRANMATPFTAAPPADRGDTQGEKRRRPASPRKRRRRVSLDRRARRAVK